MIQKFTLILMSQKKNGVTAGAIGHPLSEYNLKRTPNMG